MSPIRPLLPGPRLFRQVKPPSRYYAPSTGLRYVKVKRPWFRVFLRRCVSYSVAIYFLSAFVLRPLDGTLHDLDSSPEDSRKGRRNRISESGETKKAIHETDEASASDSLFIPLGWPRLRDGNFYAPSDPEWQAFVKISRDDEKLRALRGELEAIVLSDASQTEQLLHMLGGPLTITQSWIVHQFPSRSPPVYHRSGLQITGSGTSWVSRPISNDDGDKFYRCIRPLSVALAGRDACLVLWRSLMSKLNLSDPDDERPMSLSRASLKTSLPTDFRTVGRLGDLSQSESQGPPPHSRQSSTTQRNENARVYSSTVLSPLNWVPLPGFGPGSNLYAASLAFKRRLKEYWTSEVPAPRRGTFHFTGPVGIRGSRGFCRIEVMGEYDPTTSEWVFIAMQLRDYSVYKQRALGS